ncbi:MAG: tRNA (adenosine(37)-N6)-dimethylallyltransferase MiaA [Lachnospiraceae bacterium]|nr:tRNA (adenosine(37)-N6)-dimethylallyltransferase MiaA [Lachnospiraceae bacterium]MBR4780976.1 tRNA (adenosine(37)-N6)-dimethylallyltransferase MiaA [Lachnospiraceae bacterium]
MGVNKDKLVVVLGTNASGKSGLGIELAIKYGAEIVSADSRQVFKGLDLGSGKVTKEEMKGVPHYLLDVAEPGDFFSLKEYQELAYKAIDDIMSRGIRPFLVGGTGLYVNAVVDGYELADAPVDTELRAKVEAMTLEELQELLKLKLGTIPDSLDMRNKRRLERAAEKILQGKPLNLESIKKYETLCLGVTWEREILYKRIEERLDRRLAEGMIEEVEGLLDKGVSDDFLYRLGLEYRYILLYLRGRFKDRDEFRAKLFMEIRHLAKEQMTWFRKRKDVHWLNMADDPFGQAVRLIDDFYDA